MDFRSDSISANRYLVQMCYCTIRLYYSQLNWAPPNRWHSPRPDPLPISMDYGSMLVELVVVHHWIRCHLNFAIYSLSNQFDPNAVDAEMTEEFQQKIREASGKLKKKWVKIRSLSVWSVATSHPYLCIYNCADFVVAQ